MQARTIIGISIIVATALLLLFLVSPIGVLVNNVFIGTQENIDFVDGTNITITALIDPTNDVVRVTINSSPTSSAYDLIQDEGANRTQQTTLNFTGAGVTCIDGATTTDCDIPSGGGGSISTTTIQIEDVTVFATTSPTLDFGLIFDVVEGPNGEANITLDFSELNDVTFGDNTDATITIIYDPTGATNPTWSYTNDSASLLVNLFIDDTKGVVIGHDSKINFGAVSEFQVLGTGTPDSSMGFARFQDNASGPDVRFLKSRGVTIGTVAIVQDNDTLGRFRFQADDGVDFNTTAVEIRAEVDGATGGNNIPGRLVFRTNAGSASVTTRMTIDSSGVIIIGDNTATNRTITFDVDESPDPSITYDVTDNRFETNKPWDFDSNNITVGGNLPTSGSTNAAIIFTSNATSPSGIATNTAAIFADEIAGNTELFTIDESDVIFPVAGVTVVRDEGIPLTLRKNINFSGTGINCADNAGTTSTDCIVTSTSTAAYDTIQQDGAPLTQFTTVNFTGVGITCTNGTTTTVCTAHTPQAPQLDDLGETTWGIPGWGWHGTTVTTVTQDRIFYIPIYVQQSRTFTQIGLHVSVGGAGGTVARLGIYAARFDGGDLTPDTLTLDAGTVAVNTAGEKSIAISQTLAEGFHFLAWSTDSGATFFRPNEASGIWTPVTSRRDIMNSNRFTLLAVDVVDGAAALPSPATAPTTGQIVGFAIAQLGE